MMNWLDPILDRLADRGPIGYGADQSPCTEPTSLAALALMAHDRLAEAEPHIAWLRDSQLPTGAVPVRRDPPRPWWTTSLASVAWTFASQLSSVQEAQLQQPLDRAAAWMLESEGETTKQQPLFGHDPTLVGWPWVDGTHTWLEPTVFHVLALSARGWASHARVVAGKKVIMDRLLKIGGANYGNTEVFGQQLLPHVQPSGLALLALADQEPNGKVRGAIEYLKRKVGQRTTPASLSWALMGLAAFGEAPKSSAQWLEKAASRKLLSAHHAALLALAAMDAENPLIQMTAEVVA